MSKRMRWIGVLVVLVLLGGSAAVGGFYWLQRQFLAAGPLQAPVRIQIDQGTSVRGVFVVGGLISIGWVLNAIGATEAMALSDRISVYRISELMRLISGVSGLEHLEGLKRLRRLDLSRTRVTDTGLAPLKKLIQLQELYLANTEITDAGLENLLELRQLRKGSIFHRFFGGSLRSIYTIALNGFVMVLNILVTTKTLS